MFCEPEYLAKKSWFADVPPAEPSDRYLIEKQYEEDASDEKLFLCSNCYHDNDIFHVFPVIRTAERALAQDNSLVKESLDPLGYKAFYNASVNMLLGEDNTARIENRTFGIQTLSTTGALRIGGEFLARVLGRTVLYVAEQAPVFNLIQKQAGFIDFRKYRYVDTELLELDIEGMIEDLSHAPEGSVITLQACSHYPTGFDLTKSQWEIVADVIAERNLFPFFCCVFQGYASGDLDEDAWPIRYFTTKNIEFFCAHSLSKSFNLANERVGCLTVFLNYPKKVHTMKMHFMNIVERMYESPPNHGARIVAFILGNQSLFETFKNSIRDAVERLRMLRSYLREELERLGAFGTWNHITSQQGIFCYTGLKDVHAEYIKKQFHIYISPCGEINISCLSLENVAYVAAAINSTLKRLPLHN